jgi:bacterial/archaeal transporter family-2 protein
MSYALIQHSGILGAMEGGSMIYLSLAPLVGGLITLMNAINSLLSARVGNLLAILVIHVTGLAAVSLIVVARREGKVLRQGGKRRLPPYLYAGGIVGVGTVFACNSAYGALGASLSVALGLLAQMAGSLVIDATGFLGRPRYPLSLRSLPGIGLALAGVIVMAGSWQGQLAYYLLALAGGLLPLLTFTLNSQLAMARGIFTSARTNYLSGLITTLLVVAVFQPSVLGRAPESLATVAATPLGLVVGGGFLGVLMLGGINFGFPKIPAFWATLLMFAGQALTGLLLDGLLRGGFSLRTLLGCLLVLAGLAANAALGRKEKKGH